MCVILKQSVFHSNFLFQLQLFNLVLGLPHCTVLGEALQCILDIHAKTGACDTGNQVLALWMCLMALFKRKPNSHPAGLAVRVMAVLLNHHMDQALRCVHRTCL